MSGAPGGSPPRPAQRSGPAPRRGAARPALVHDWLTGMRGGEKVLEAIASLVPGSPIYTLFHFEGAVSAALEAHPIRVSALQRLPGVRNGYRRYLPLFPHAIERFDLGGHDLVISSSHCVAKGAVPPPGAFHLCYCHTPMRYAWDQRHVYFGDRPWPLRLAIGAVLARLRRWDRSTASRVDEFVANSRFVARRIADYYGRDAEVVHPPAEVEFFTPGEGAPGRYCLMVAALNPYKRIEVAIAAAARAGVELRIVGDGPDRRRLEREAAASAATVVFCGRVEAGELRRLYRGARCLVQPGVEDFGIAAVEALACGRPVAALGRGGVLDIVDDGVHGVLYDGDGAEALTAAIDKSAKLQFNSLNLRERAEAFSKARFLERLYRRLAPHLETEAAPS